MSSLPLDPKPQYTPLLHISKLNNRPTGAMTAKVNHKSQKVGCGPNPGNPPPSPEKARVLLPLISL